MKRHLSWLKRKLLKWLGRDIDTALHVMYQKGIEFGKKQSRVIYGQYCESCGFRLQQVRPSVFVCPICLLNERHTGPSLPIMMATEGNTDALQIERPLFWYLENQRSAGVKTKQHRAVHWEHMPS